MNLSGFHAQLNSCPLLKKVSGPRTTVIPDLSFRLDIHFLRLEFDFPQGKTERRCREAKTFASYSGGFGFKSRPEDRLS
jgi:hypothetical protein